MENMFFVTVTGLELDEDAISRFIAQNKLEQDFESFFVLLGDWRAFCNRWNVVKFLLQTNSAYCSFYDLAIIATHTREKLAEFQDYDIKA